jgi:hypothetical protein
MPAKTKTPQKENLEEAQNRDFFQTPNYAVDILVPFLEEIQPMSPYKKFTIWECAAGQRKISKRLEHFGFNVISTDIQDQKSFNFLTDEPDFEFDCIVTNTPFSLKKKFYEKCLSFEKAFSLLIPADYSLWLIDAVDKMKCEKIIPERRIDYITPNTLNRIHYGEVWEYYLREHYDGIELKEYKKNYPNKWEDAFMGFDEYFNYKSIYDAPAELIRKYSSSDFHSMWITRYFNLGKSETFVELTNKMKDNI